MGGGIVLDRVHELDYLRWLMGNVKEVCALTGRLSNLEIDSEDTAEILLQVVKGGLPERKVVVNKDLYDQLAKSLQATPV